MITIVIPTYNRSKTLEKTLPTYLTQNPVDEVVIVDDCSKDDTEKKIRELIRENPKIKYIRHETHKGACAAKKTGIINSKNNFILFGEDDVLLEKNYSTQLLKCLEKNNADIIGGRLIYLKKGEHPTDAIKRCDKKKSEIINKKTIEGDFSIKTNTDVEVLFLHACSLYKKKVFEEIPIDENYKGNGYREETDPFLCAHAKNHKIVYCPHTACFHLPRDEVPSGGQWSMSRLKYEYWTIRNNNYFLKKHHKTLKEKMGIKNSIHTLKIYFLLSRIKRVLADTLYWTVKKTKEILT